MGGNGEVPGKKRKQSRSPRRRARGPRTHAYPYELRRKAVQVCLEEGFPVEQVARELGVGVSTLGTWVRRYRALGEAGLQAKARPRSPRPQVAAAVETWLQSTGAITITQNNQVLPVLLRQIAHN